MKTDMNHKIFFTLLALFLIASVIGCRDEITNTENTNPPTDSLLFSKDSIYLGFSNDTSEVTYRILDPNITKIKVSYSLETDDITDTATTSSFLLIADSSFSIMTFGHNNNGNFEYICNIKLKNTTYADARFSVNRYLNSHYYIVMRNIKLYRTN